MQSFHSYDPQTGHGHAHDPIKAIVAPRPIGWISTTDGQGSTNLTLRTVEAAGEFCCDLPMTAQAQLMNLTSTELPPGENKKSPTDLRSLPNRAISPQSVAGSPAALECQVAEIKQLQAADGDLLDAFVVTGQVFMLRIDDQFFGQGPLRNDDSKGDTDEQ